MQTALLRELLERANAEPLGLRVRSNMAQTIASQLAAVRKEIGGLDNLMLCIPSIPDHVFIVHKSVELTYD